MPEVLRKQVALVGAERWLEELPYLVGRLEQRWHVTVGRPLTGGHEAYVAEAVTSDGDDVVLKLLVTR